MDTIKATTTAGATLEAQIKAIQAATVSGDIKALSNALRVGGIASMIVEKSAAIAENPEKYEKAAEEKAAGWETAVTASDIRAKAEGFLRFKSANRALSAVNKVEALLTKMTAAPARKGRKARYLVN